MRNPLSKRIMIRVVLITVLAGAALGRGVINGTSQGGPRHTAGHLRVDKILFGIPSQPSSSRIAPYMAFIETTLSDGRQERCGGTLIHKEWVLTAAHCVYKTNEDQHRVMLGSLDVGQEGSYYGVDKVIWHGGFVTDMDPTTRVMDQTSGWFDVNDIALLKLSTQVDTSKDNVKVAHLAVSGSSRGAFDGTECMIAGWGSTESTVHPTRLREMTIPNMISQQECENIFGEGTAGMFDNNWRHYHICVLDVDNKHRGTCNADSGGPLMCGPGHDILVGVAKTGYGDCGQGFKKQFRPDTFTRVAPHRQWIEATMSGENVSTGPVQCINNCLNQ